MKKILITFFICLMAIASANAKTLYPDSKTAKSEIELGVEVFNVCVRQVCGITGRSTTSVMIRI